jgi:23S rRNA G2069 N7-methylase RlmK/C1962 C5-methylase RlmI
MVIADPPSFSRGPDGDWAGKGGLPRLVQACATVTRNGGWLVVASNQGKVTPKDFHRAVQQGARKADCQLRIIHQGSPPIDFPAALDFPESRYLKVWVLHLERQA